MILELKDVKIDAFYCCPHMPAELNGESCYCRKPNPGMFLKAIKKWNININDSFFIGDSISDFNAAKKIKIKFYYKKKISLYKQIKAIINK